MPRATRSLLAKRFAFVFRCSCCANRINADPAAWIDGDKRRPP